MRDKVKPSIDLPEILPRRQPSAAFTADEKRRIFKSMVVGELEAGFLRYSKREELLRYAAVLGIQEFEAMLLMAEAQHQADQLEPVYFNSAATLDALSRPHAWSAAMRLWFALAVAIGIDLLLIYWLYR
ncbi:MAG: hypothetical protein HRF43_11595 [Phycisphaerae bacterium]